jgi:hypothetical protein
MKDAVDTAILLVERYKTGKISLPEPKYARREAIDDLGLDFCRTLGRDNHFAEDLAFAIEMARRGWYDELLLNSARNSPSANYVNQYIIAKQAVAI